MLFSFFLVVVFFGAFAFHSLPLGVAVLLSKKKKKKKKKKIKKGSKTTRDEMNFLKRVKEKIGSSGSTPAAGTPTDLIKAEAGLEASRRHYREVLRTGRALSKALGSV
jgi:hypothetical protein